MIFLCSLRRMIVFFDIAAQKTFFLLSLPLSLFSLHRDNQRLPSTSILPNTKRFSIGNRTECNVGRSDFAIEG